MIKKVEISTDEIAQGISSMWNTLSAEQYNLLLKSLVVRKFKKNDEVYSLGSFPTHAQFLVQGKVKIYKEGISRRKQIIRAIKPNEFFGYRAYFANDEYRTGAIALETSIVALIPIDVFVKLLEQNFNVSLFFIRYLCVEIGKSDDRTVSLTQKHIRARLAEALIFLQESYGFGEDEQTLNILLSREDLSTICNMTTSNCIRTLSAFAKEGLVAIDGKRIKILQKAALRQISEQG